MDTPSPYSPPTTSDLTNKDREKQVNHCLVLLEMRKDQLAIINYLRKNGYSVEEAKNLSYGLFDQAKKKLMRSQLLTLILAYVFFAIGLIAAFSAFYMGLNIALYLFWMPICFGMFLKTKIINPTRLP